MNPLTVPQGTFVTPKTLICLGRMKAAPGRVFWVTDTVLTRTTRQTIHLAPKGKSSGFAVALTLSDFATHFSLIP